MVLVVIRKKRERRVFVLYLSFEYVLVPRDHFIEASSHIDHVR
nr:C601 [uncultured bacterium]